MQFDNSTPRADVTISGLVFKVPTPYSAGHVCTPNEAAALNQLICENIRNNRAPMVAKAKEAAEKAGQPLDESALQADIDAYAAEYEMGVRRGRVVDPVEKEAREIALGHVKAHLQKKNLAFSSLTAEKRDTLIDQLLEKYPQIRKQAQEVVARRNKAASQELELDLA